MKARKTQSTVRTLAAIHHSNDPNSSAKLNLADAVDVEVGFAWGVLAAFEAASREGGISENAFTKGALTLAYAHAHRLDEIKERLESILRSEGYNQP